MRHLRTVTVAKASTNQGGSSGVLGIVVWIVSQVLVLKNFDL